MSQQASLASAGSSIQTKPIKGFGKLGRHVNSLLSDMKRAEVVAGQGTSVSATTQGRSINSRSTASNTLGGIELPEYPTTDGTYVLGVVVTGGNPVLQWLATDTCD